MPGAMARDLYYTDGEVWIPAPCVEACRKLQSATSFPFRRRPSSKEQICGVAGALRKLPAAYNHAERQRAARMHADDGRHRRP